MNVSRFEYLELLEKVCILVKMHQANKKMENYDMMTCMKNQLEKTYIFLKGGSRGSC